MATPRVITAGARASRARIHSDPTDAERAYRRRRRSQQLALPSGEERMGTVFRAPFIVEDETGRKLAEIGLHTRADGKVITRFRLYSVDGQPGVTVFGDLDGGGLAVHSPGSERSALLLHSDEQGGIIEIRDGSGETAVELPADLEALAEKLQRPEPQALPGPEPEPPAPPAPWWAFWKR